MATARELITDSLVEINIIAAGQAPEADDAALGLSRLNTMLGLMSIDGLMLVSEDEDLYLVPANVQSPTIGASGTFVATRPTSIDAANAIDITGTILGTGATTGAGNLVLTDATQNFTTSGVVAGRDLVYVVSGTGVTAGIYRISTVGTTTLTLTTNPGSSGSAIVYRVIVIPERSPIDVSRNVDWWAGRRTRGNAGTPADLFYNAGVPNGTLNLYPLSDVAIALELFTKTQRASVASLDTSLNLAPGDYGMLMTNLAVDLCEPFEKTPSALLLSKASNSRAKVKARNARRPRLTSDVPMGRRW